MDPEIERELREWLEDIQREHPKASPQEHKRLFMQEVSASNKAELYFEEMHRVWFNAVFPEVVAELEADRLARQH